MAKNEAAWIKSGKANPLIVEEAPLWTVGEHEILINNHAVAVNPADYKIQDYDVLIKSYPAILGFDIAGTVEAVGTGVTDFAKGDRVLGFASFPALDSNPKYAGFQRFTVVPDIVATKIPANVSFAEAAVLPAALATAAHGFYSEGYLGLKRPDASKPDASLANKSLLVWGGSGSVGSAAILLAARAGYHVVATASRHNHDFVRSLGATHVVDYADADAVTQLKNAVKGEWIGAFDAVSENGTTEKCAEVIEKGLIAIVLPPSKALKAGVTTAFVNAGLLATSEKEIGKWLFTDYLPKALANGTIKCAPEPLIVKGGLSKIQEGIDILKKGVSARKVVVLIDH